MKKKGSLAVIVILVIVVLVTILTYFMFNYYKDQGKFEEQSLAIEAVEMNGEQTLIQRFDMELFGNILKRHELKEAFTWKFKKVQINYL